MMGAQTRLACTPIFEHTEVADEPQALMHLCRPPMTCAFDMR